MSAFSIACDVAVVGAGPGGSLAALRLARAGRHVVLFDRVRFPRRKVCGACLGPAAIDVLEREGLRDRLDALGGHRLDQMELRGPEGSASIRLQGNLAVSREALDEALVVAARASGVYFVDGCRVTVARVDADGIDLETPRGAVRARVVVDASGLAGALDPSDPPRSTGVQADSRIGAGAVYPAEAFGLPAGVLRMVVGSEGYAGLVRVEDGTVNVAAALAPAEVAVSGLEGAVDRLLRASGASPSDVSPLKPWKGTPPLTWSPHAVASARVFRIGDAAGYVEPFTGEGMAWALQAAVQVTPFVDAAVTRWDDDLIEGWSRTHDRTLGRRRRTCRWLARGLRSETLVRYAIAATARAPFLATPFVRATSRVGTPCTPTGVT